MSKKRELARRDTISKNMRLPRSELLLHHDVSQRANERRCLPFYSFGKSLTSMTWQGRYGPGTECAQGRRTVWAARAARGRYRPALCLTGDLKLSEEGRQGVKDCRFGKGGSLGCLRFSVVGFVSVRLPLALAVGIF